MLVPPVDEESRGRVQPLSAYARAVETLELGEPPLRPMQIVEDGDRSRVVVTVGMSRYCALGIQRRREAVRAYARTVDAAFDRVRAATVRLVVSMPSDTGRMRPIDADKPAELARDPVDPERVNVLERWAHRDDLDAFRSSTSSSETPARSPAAPSSSATTSRSAVTSRPGQALRRGRRHLV